MIKKLIIGAMLVVIGFFLVNYQINAIEYASRDDKSVEIYMINKSINEGDQLKTDDLNIIRIDKDYFNDSMVTELPEDVVYYCKSKRDGDILLSSDFSKSKPIESYMTDTNSAIITLRMAVDEANGWGINRGDVVDLYFVSESEDVESMIYPDVKVCNILKQNPLVTDQESYDTPEYLSLFVPREKVMEILNNKEYGRYEVVIK